MQIDIATEVGTEEFRNILYSAVPMAPGELKKQWEHRACNFLQVSIGRLWSLRYNSNCKLKPQELKNLTRALSGQITTQNYEMDALTKKLDEIELQMKEIIRELRGRN